LKRITDFFKRLFRKYYEGRINLKFGVSQFIANVAFIQLTHEEFLMLSPPSAYCGDIHLTTVGMRPVLTYPVWVPGMAYPDDEKLPIVQAIIDSNEKFQVRDFRDEKNPGEWEPVTIQDPRVSPLKDLFLAFAFFCPLRTEFKRKIAA
jgi:hypothetical protein